MRRVRRIAAPAGFALRRIRARIFVVAGLSLALAAAAALIGWSSVSATRAHEKNVRLRLDEVSFAERSFQAAYTIEVRGSDWAAEPVEASLAKLADVTEPPNRIRIWHAKGATAGGIRFVEAPDVVLAAGRLPSDCAVGVCDALALAGEFRVGELVPFEEGATVRVVGLGSLPPAALPDPEELGSRALLVGPRNKKLTGFLLERASTVLVTAGLDPEAVQASRLRKLHTRLRQELIRLERGQRLDANAPLDLLDDLAQRGDVARSRVLLVAGQGAALIIAFAAFAATTRRRDTEGGAEQLSTLGAARGQLWTARAVEALLPPLAGGLAAIVALLVLARQLGTSFPFDSILAMAAVMVAAGAILFASVASPRRSRFGVGMLELAAVVALALVAWQTAATGGLDPSGIEAGERAGPVLLLLPALASFVTAVVLLRLLPFLLRLGERGARSAPFGARLAFITAARAPAQAAAATTFLAVALGAALFGFNYEATLERQARDEAAFAAGAAWRVLERPEGNVAGVDLGRGSDAPGDVAPSLGPIRERSSQPTSDVTPLTRYRRVTQEQPTPVIRLDSRLIELGAAGEEVAVEVLAIPAGRVPDIMGWRDSFSSLDRSELGQRLRPKPVRLTGPRIAADARTLRLWAVADTVFPRVAVLHVLFQDQQRFRPVRLSALPTRWAPLSLKVPAALRGAEVIGIEFPPTYQPFGSIEDRGFIELGGLEQRRAGGWEPLSSLEDWTSSRFGGAVYEPELEGAPIDRGLRFEVQAASLAFIRPGSQLPAPLPAIVTEPVAAAAVNGKVTLELLGEDVEVRVAGVAELFPTVVGRPSSFVVLDYEALFARLNRDQPGLILPAEAWFFGPQPPSFLDRLRDPPFRLERATGAGALEARLMNDPLGAGAREVLRLAAFAAALLGVLGLVLATRAALVSERTLFAEYEALGVPPRTLVRSAQARLLLLSLLGVAGGVLAGLLAVRLIAVLVSVTGTAGRPLPPVEPVIAWAVDVAVVLAACGTGLAAAALLAGRVLRESAARRLRA